jgi:hypothetical protein
MNLREIVGQIRLRVIQDGKNASPGAGESKEISACRDAAMELRIASEDMQDLGAGVGRMPPSPATTRAKFGAYLVRVVQRALFWYTPQIVRFNMAASGFAEQACNAAEKHVAALQQIDKRLTELSGEVHRGGPADDTEFDLFVADYRKRREALSAERQDFFRELRQMVDLACPGDGPWLDVDNGASGWMTSTRGRGIATVDATVLLSEESGPLFAVIAAIGVLERHPVERSFEILRHCTLRLAPGGLLMVTGADPASVTAGGTEFWEDPRRVRPLPASTVIAMVEYLGLSVIETRGLRELPREYAILARREPRQ